MLISIVTICYNNRAGVEETWRSVQSQTSPDWEWIVVDGASSDGTPDFLAALTDPRIRWVSEKDAGLYDAMNKGLERAGGEYVTFLNSGDLFADPDVLQEVARFTDSNGLPDLCYGDAYEMTPEGERLLKRALTHRRVWYGMFTHHQAMFYRLEFVRPQSYRLNYKIAADYAFTAETLARGGKALHLALPLCVFEKGGLSERSAALGRAEVWDVQRTILRMPLALRLGVRLTHLTTNRLKNLSPRVYKALRYRVRQARGGARS